jgi:hypothetical protein
MTTEADIASQALTNNGFAAITALDKNSKDKAAQTVSYWYDAARREMLTRYNWRCCLKNTVLASDADYDEGTRYRLPADFLSLHTILPKHYTLESGYIYFRDPAGIFHSYYNLDGSTGLRITYVFDNVDPNTYAPLLHSALVAVLSEKVALSDKGDEKMAKRFWEQHLLLIEDAKRHDSIQAPIRLVPKRESALMLNRRYSTIYYGSMLDRLG